LNLLLLTPQNHSRWELLIAAAQLVVVQGTQALGTSLQEAHQASSGQVGPSLLHTTGQARQSLTALIFVH
jgi:hypothetical protein